MEKEIRQKPAFHWAWMILVVCFLNLFINYGIRLGYSIVLPEIIRTMGLTRRQGGDIFNAFFFAYIGLSPFAGYLTDRFGARRIISLFGGLLGIGTFLLGTANSYWQGCFFFALVGMGASAMWTPSLTIVQKWFSLERRGMALGILTTGSGLGFAVMGKVFPIIVETWNWRYCWYFLGLAAVFMVLVNAVLLRSKPEDMGLQPWGGGLRRGLPSQSPSEIPKAKTRYSEILTTSRFWIIGFSYLLIAACVYAVTTYLVDYARYNLGFPYEKASSLAIIHGLGQIAGVLIIPLISDYIGRRWMICLSNIFMAASIASIIISGANELWLPVSVGIFGAFFGATFPLYGACGGDYFRKELMGSVIGAWIPFYGLGAIGGNRMAGYLRDVTGSFFIPFLIAILMALVASLLMIFVKYQRIPEGVSLTTKAS